MHKFFKLTINAKLFLSVFCSSLLILIVLNAYNYNKTSDAILEHEYDHLLTSRELKRDMITEYLNDAKQEIIYQSINLIHELEELRADPFETLSLLSTDIEEDGYLDIEKYDELFSNTGLSQNEIYDILLENYIDLQRTSDILLDDVNGVNLYLIDNEGRIIFNKMQFKDSMRNINEPEFADEGILKCVNILKERQGESNYFKVTITDMSNYSFYENKPVIFAGININIRTSSGYLVLMLTAENINRIMTKWTGLGRTGETYLVGPDHKMRNNSRFIVQEPERYFALLEKSGYDTDLIELMKEKKTTMLHQEIHTTAVTKAFNGEDNTELIYDYRGIPVISSYSLFKYDNLRWAIISEIDVKEAFEKIYQLRRNIASFSVSVIIVLLIISRLLAKKITKRLLLLKESAYRVSKGDYSLTIEPVGTDEIDDLTNSFNSMTLDLKEKEEELLAKNYELEEKVIERTKELEAEKEFSEKVVTTAASFIAVIDNKGIIRVANDAFINITACKKEELLGCSFLRFITDDEHGASFKEFLLSESLDKGHFDCEIKTKRFEKRIISWDAAAIKTKHGRLAITIGQDVTERIKLSNRLKKKTDDIESFVYSVSHDLKNPTISLMGMLDLLIEDCYGSISTKGKFYLDRLKANTAVINDLLQGLLDVSRLGMADDIKEDIDLKEIVDHVINENMLAIKENNVSVIVKEPLPKVYFSKIRLYQVISNLFKNSLKFSHEDKNLEIKFGCDETKEEYVCNLQDNGIGIDEEYHSKVFEMFSRLREKEAEGTGIGLTIVKRIIDDSGGRIWVESKKGEGTTFFIAIPKKIVIPE